MWDSVIVLCFVFALLCVHSFDWEERAVCFAVFVTWRLVIVVWLLRVCLQFVIVVFPDHTNLLVFMLPIPKSNIGMRNLDLPAGQGNR